jgi:hypothetical protein
MFLIYKVKCKIGDPARALPDQSPCDQHMILSVPVKVIKVKQMSGGI